MPDYEFSVDWFPPNIPVWQAVFKTRLPVKKVLEIGTFEGRSAVWLLENIVTQGQLYCIDTWYGGPTQEGMEMMAQVEGRFIRNIERVRKETSGRSRVEVIKGTSFDGMLRLLANGHASSFDFIYVDGGHECANTLIELSLAFLLCRVGGIICCDDYLWSRESEGSEDLLTQPKLAIDSFVNCFCRKVKVLYGIPLYQIFMEKIRE